MNPVKDSAANQQKPYLVVRDLVKKFGQFTALDKVGVDIAEGEFICFLGPSGCGKTTFLRAIAGLDFQNSGLIEQNGRDISDLPPSKRDFGIVFQSYALFPNLTVERNIAYGLENQGQSKATIKARVEELLELVGLPEQIDKYPSQLSGGQQQRIAFARAIATSPGLLLLDEPLSALDAKVRVHLGHELKKLQRRLGVTTIMVTHDQEEALSMADRIVVMNHGVIDQIGTPIEIYREPASLFVADFIGTTNHLSATAGKSGAVTIKGANLVTQSHDIAAGSDVIASIRPEDIIVYDKASKAKNHFAAVIGEMEFLGSYWRTRLTVEKFGSQEIIADFSINATRRMDLAEGGKITIELPADRVKVFASGT